MGRSHRKRKSNEKRRLGQGLVTGRCGTQGMGSTFRAWGRRPPPCVVSCKLSQKKRLLWARDPVLALSNLTPQLSPSLVYRSFSFPIFFPSSLFQLWFGACRSEVHCALSWPVLRPGSALVIRSSNKKIYNLTDGFLAV